MKVSMTPAPGPSDPAQSRQVKQRLANPQESLSYELGKAVQELPPLYTRLLTGGISALVLGTITWAHFSVIDEVAVTQGKLIPSTEVRPIRASAVGSIDKVNVKAGDVIRKDDVLIELSPGAVETNVESLEKDAQKIREDITRLEAERQGSTDGGTPLQDQLLNARQREFVEKQSAAVAEANRQVAAIQEARTRLERFQENLINARTNLENATKTRDNAQERVNSLEKLEQGVVPRLELLNARDQLTRAQDQITEAEDKIVSLEKEMDAQQDRIRQSEQAYESARSTAQGVAPQRETEILTQLNQRREELQKKMGEIAVAKQQKSERETIKAPFDGTVYNVKSTQGPVQQGEEMLSILPTDQDLVLEVKVLNRDIGFIRKDQRVKVKLAAFPYQEFGIVDGVVTTISPDAVVEKDETGRDMGPVFPVKVKLDRTSIPVRDRKVDLTPGMVATGEIVTRQKSILTFFMEPVTRRFNEAFSVR
jgi:HlyD family secretion protein